MSGHARFYQESDHAIVYGIPGVAFQQNGRYFRRDGSLVDGDPDREREVAELRGQLADPTVDFNAKELLKARLRQIGEPTEEPKEAAPQSRAEPVFVPPALKENTVGEDDLRRAENKALKAQLDIYGEPWTTRKAAIEFLGKGRE